MQLVEVTAEGAEVPGEVPGEERTQTALMKVVTPAAITLVPAEARAVVLEDHRVVLLAAVMEVGQVLVLGCVEREQEDHLELVE